MLADKVGDDGIEVGVPAGEAGDGGFGPDQQVGSVGQGLFGEVDQLVEPVQVSAGVPDQRLGNAGLDEGDVQGAGGDGFPRQLPEAEVEEDGQNHSREHDFAGPDRACGGPQHDHQPGGEQRKGNPNDEERHAVDAGGGSDLDERRHLIL